MRGFHARVSFVVSFADDPADEMHGDARVRASACRCANRNELTLARERLAKQSSAGCGLKIFYPAHAQAAGILRHHLEGWPVYADAGGVKR